MIEPDIDIYGRDATLCALADFLELQAIVHEQSMSSAELQRYIDSNDWEEFDPDLIVGPETTRDAREEISAAELAGRVFGTLSERANLLQGRYPFSLDGSRVRHSHGAPSQYTFLLALCTHHAYNISIGDAPPKPYQLFEQLVVDSLEGYGIEAAGIPLGGAANFGQRLNRALQPLDLSPNVQAAYRRVTAQDSGVDVVGHLWLGDSRAGRWIFTGQATVGKSETWQRKAREVLPRQWSDFLRLTRPPIPFLAIPHHMDSLQMAAMSRNTDCIVLDRLRLALHNTQTAEKWGPTLYGSLQTNSSVLAPSPAPRRAG